MRYAQKLIAMQRAQANRTDYPTELNHPDPMQRETLKIEARDLTNDERKADQKLRAIIRRELAKCEDAKQHD